MLADKHSQVPPMEGSEVLPKVIVISHSTLIGHQIRRAVQRYSDVEVSVAGPDTALMLIAAEAPDILLLNLEPTDPGLSELLQFLREARFRGQLLIMSGTESQSDETAVRAIENQARQQGIDLLATLPWPCPGDTLSIITGDFKVQHAKAFTPAALSQDDIVKALTEGQIKAFYQPKVAIPSGEILGFEALSRWRLEDDSYLSPGVFIPAIERFGLMAELTKCTAQQVIEQLGEWVLDGHSYTVSINVSTEDLESATFAEWLMTETEQGGVPANQLVVEVTESRLTQDPAKLIANLSRLRSAGFKVSIDDFGTGYSSLEQLQRFAADELKIDQAFVSGAGNDRNKRIILEHSVGLGKQLSMTTVAEGIETLDDWLQVAASGGDVCQGWFAGKALPAEDIDAWRAEWNERRASLPQADNATVDTEDSDTGDEIYLSWPQLALAGLGLALLGSVGSQLLTLI